MSSARIWMVKGLGACSFLSFSGLLVAIAFKSQRHRGRFLTKVAASDFHTTTQKTNVLHRPQRARTTFWEMR